MGGTRGALGSAGILRTGVVDRGKILGLEGEWVVALVLKNRTVPRTASRGTQKPPLRSY